MKKRFYCLLAAVLMAGACICVPVAEVKAEDGYKADDLLSVHNPFLLSICCRWFSTL